MAIFISYNQNDSDFVDKLAKNLVMRRHNVWVDRWELNIGDSLIDKIQGALTKSDAMLIILSKNSVASEWCKKELNSGLMRELEEKRVLVLPCVIDDCEIPLFLREKLYADFRKIRMKHFGKWMMRCRGLRTLSRDDWRVRRFIQIGVMIGVRGEVAACGILSGRV